MIDPSRASASRRARRGAALLSLVTFAASCTLARGASAQTKAECVAAYKDGQLHRKNGELIEARASLRICSATACPDVLRRDCVPWLAQVSSSIPSLLVSVSGSDGRAIVAPNISLDAQAVTPSSDGSIETDPGAHLLHVEADGYQATAQAVKLRAGDRGTKILITLAPIPKPVVPSSRPLPIAAIAFTAVGLAGVASFATFGLIGDAAKSGLEACKPACAPSRVDEVKRDYVIADVSLGVGAIFLGLATYSFLTRSDAPRGSSSLFTSPLRAASPFTQTDLVLGVDTNGARVTLTGLF